MRTVLTWKIPNINNPFLRRIKSTCRQYDEKNLLRTTPATPLVASKWPTFVFTDPIRIGSQISRPWPKTREIALVSSGSPYSKKRQYRGNKVDFVSAQMAYGLGPTQFINYHSEGNFGKSN